MSDIQIHICKKYAQTFFDKFADKIDESQIENIKNLAEFLKKNKNLLFILQLAFIDYKIKQDLIDKLFKKFNIIQEFKKLIDLLDLEIRISWLSDILLKLIDIYNINNNIMNFTIVSPILLNEKDILRVKNFLSRSTNKNIIYKVSIDKTLIAGLKIYSDTFLWEHSIKKQLLILKKAYRETL